MWTASNRHVLPSAQERIGIKKTINLLESELAAARELLEQTQARIADLEAKLAQGKASISPIRRLPFEILSEIFGIYCIEERLAPLIIARVCYEWREAIIGTPLAWSRIFPQNFYQDFLPKDYVSLFLERSSPCLLHLSMPWTREACICSGNSSKEFDEEKCDCVNVETIFQHSHRIQCLSAQLEWMREYSTVPFENLAHLTIIWDDYTSIKWTVSLLDDQLIGQFSQASGTRLKYLSISPDEGAYWLDLVQLCASTLTTLVVCGDFVPSRKRVIKFPELESLIVTAPASAVCLEAPVLEVVAPNLAFYEIGFKVGSSGIVHDVKIHKVTHLCTHQAPSLRDYPLLRTLHVPNSFIVVEGILVQLEQDMSICPALQRIHLSSTSDAFNKAWEAYPGDPPERRLAKRNSGAGSDANFVFNSKSPNSAPGYYHTCTEDMPCRMNL